MMKTQYASRPKSKKSRLQKWVAAAIKEIFLTYGLLYLPSASEKP